MNIASIFDEVAIQMRADLEKARRALSHSGLKGSALEETFKTFLRDYLPRSLDISSGQIVDSHGGISKQLDVIISDAAKTPIFYRNADTRVIPIECVYAVIEVKAFLDKEELKKTYANMESVRKLQKTAYLPASDLFTRTFTMYGKTWDIWPVNYFVFAYESTDLHSLTHNLYELHAVHGATEDRRIDTVCVLDKGVVTNRVEGNMYDALPEPGSILQYLETTRALLLFHSLTSRYFNQAWMPTFRFIDYVRDIAFGDEDRR